MVPQISRLPTLLGRTAQATYGAAAKAASGTRQFSSLPTLRPTVARPLRPTTAFHAHPTTATTPIMSTTASTPNLVAVLLDLASPASITRNPAFGGLGSQVRFGSRPTMEVNSRLKRKRQCGFVSRMKTAKGRKMIKRRLAKGRKRLGADS